MRLLERAGYAKAMTCLRIGLLSVVAVGMVVTLSAQTARPTFEVASVRRNASGSGGSSFNARPGGAFVATNVRLAELILFAYNLRDSQLTGGPAWMRADRFDIAARALNDQPLAQVKLMLQVLLEDRFRLMVRWEQHETRVYALVLARSDRRLGVDLRQADPDCLTGTAQPPAPRSPSREPGSLVRDGDISRGTCIPLLLLAVNLSGRLGSEVADKTGLTGLWDFDLTFAEQSLVPADAGTSVDPGVAPSLFTALQEQLGLKLESTRGPVDVLLIDSVQQPTEN
jgi:uncharacterized protein (TIGR03435 family)